MHDIEPYYNWRGVYIAEEDENSPFYQREYSEFEFTNAIYNFALHPQWDDIGSPTLFVKILMVDYPNQYAIIELIGEWNDCINNDIMLFKRDVIEPVMAYGINKFILVGDNVLNFHYSDDCYYEEWYDEVEDGWIACINFRAHVLQEFKKYHIDYYFNIGGTLDQHNWRTKTPQQVFDSINAIISKRIG